MAFCLLSFFVSVGYRLFTMKKAASGENSRDDCKSRYHTGCRQDLPTSLARNAGAAIPPTALQRDISRTRFPEPVAAALALCCGSLMDLAGFFFRSSILCTYFITVKQRCQRFFRATLTFWKPAQENKDGFPEKSANLTRLPGKAWDERLKHEDQTGKR